MSTVLPIKISFLTDCHFTSQTHLVRLCPTNWLKVSCTPLQLAPESSRKSRKRQAVPRPAGGYSLLVRTLGVKQAEPYVAKPNSERRPLTQSEKEQFNRLLPIPRRRQI